MSVLKHRSTCFSEYVQQRLRCTNSAHAAFAPLAGSLCDKLIGRTTEMGHAVGGFDSDLGLGCLGLQFTAAQFRSDDLFVAPDLCLDS